MVLMLRTDTNVQRVALLILMCALSKMNVSHAQQPNRQAVVRGSHWQFSAHGSDGSRSLNNQDLEVPNSQYAADNTSEWLPESHLSLPDAANVKRVRVPMIRSFVRVEGARFVTGCKEYKVVGWNTYTLIEQAVRLPIGSFDYDFSFAGRRQVTEMLDEAVAAGFNTVRTW